MASTRISRCTFAAALDERGGLLGTASFATTPAGYRELVEWFASLGTVVLVGVEGTGSYGVGLTRHLQALGIVVVEVDRPNRQRRRRVGKSDTHDAISAARAAFAGGALGAPKQRDGNVEAIRVLRLGCVRSAKRDRTRALNQMRALVTTAPDELRSTATRADYSTIGERGRRVPSRGTHRRHEREPGRAQVACARPRPRTRRRDRDAR